jgi:hypothetical protein
LQCAFVAGVWLSSLAAHAAPPDRPKPASPAKGNAAADDATKEAIARFKRGLELYKEGAYPTALIEFRKAYELSPNFHVLYNIGLVCSEMQDAVCAVRSLQAYLEQATDITPQRKKEVEKEIARMKPRTATLIVETSTDGVDLTIDDVFIGKTPIAQGTLVNSGRRKLSLAKTGFIPVQRVVEVPGQDTMTVRIEMLAQRPPEEPAPKQEKKPLPEAPPPATKSRMTTASWIGVGTAGVLGATSVVTGIVALTRSSSYQSTVYSSAASAQSARDSTHAFALTSDITGALAIVTAGVTLGLTFLRPQKSDSARASVTVGISPTGASLQGQF